MTEKCNEIVVPVIVGALSMIKKGRDKHNNMILGRPSLYEIQNLHSEEYYLYCWKIIYKNGSNKDKYRE